MILEAHDLKRRAGHDDPWLLHGVDVSISAGDRLGLVGPSGSGKTVLLRALSRLDPTDAGEVLWCGSTVYGSRVPEFRAHVTYLHQRPAFVEGSVEHNLRLPFSLKQHRDKAFQRKRVDHWLAELDRNEDFLVKNVADLSGGEAQLAGLLRALQLDPHVLLLDEPTAALDRHTATLVEKLVAAWLHNRPDERAYIWVSHDPQQTQRMSDTLLEIRNGQIEG